MSGTTVNIDTPTALQAADNWRTLGKLVPTIRLYLEPQRTKSEVHSPPRSKPPIDTTISDLLQELEDAANFYTLVLIDETKDINTWPATLTDRLNLIAQRHGHFTTATDRTATDYCDTAHHLLNKTATIITKPPPPAWLGPCTTGCGGNLWLKHGKLAAKCDQCGSAIDLEQWRTHLYQALESRLMHRDEIAPAIRLLGGKCTANTIRTWIHRRKLQPILADSELYRFAEAMELAHITPSAALDTAS